MRSNPFFRYLTLFAVLICISVQVLQAQDSEKLDSVIYLPAMDGSVYELLEQVTAATGYLFIYDSQILDNEKEAGFEEGRYTVSEAIRRIISNTELEVELRGRHILIRKAIPEEPKIVDVVTNPMITYSTVEGNLTDQYSEEPIAYAAIGVMGTSIGTITNQNGDFRIRLADSLAHYPLHFSHLGYEPVETDIREMTGKFNHVQLEPKVISIQEVIVRLYNPMKLIQEMLDKREDNYTRSPVYLTTFYREGVERRKGFVTLTEGVFKIYKPGIASASPEQVKLLKMRKITNILEKDTIIAKMRSGIRASLLLDIVKNLPDFLLINDPDNPYHYFHSDITIIDGRLANVIDFEQKKGVKLPFYKGKLYLDNDNDALLMTTFEVHPDYVEKATEMFVERKTRGLKITTKNISYSVSYKALNGQYYINHIRGDLYFSIRKQRGWFNSPMHTWFEMVTCNVETEDVSRFGKNETINKTAVFSETKFTYDSNFWDDFNFIIPEDALQEAISKISAKIEQTGY